MAEETTAQLRGKYRTTQNGTDRGGNTLSSPSTTDKSAPPHPSTPAPGPSSHSTLAYVFLFLLVDLLGFTVILPLIPSLLEYYDKHDEVFFPILFLYAVQLNDSSADCVQTKHADCFMITNSCWLNRFRRYFFIHVCTCSIILDLIQL